MAALAQHAPVGCVLTGLSLFVPRRSKQTGNVLSAENILSKPKPNSFSNLCCPWLPIINGKKAGTINNAKHLLLMKQR
jgi:hypothetical protein